MATKAGAAGVIDPEKWRAHLETQILPFWLHPDALGDPVGLYPSIRCNDGTLVDIAAPCVEVTSLRSLTPQNHFSRAISGQSFAYGVAFHMTGEQAYLDLAKAGVDHLLGAGLDRTNGGNFVYFDEVKGSWEPGSTTITLPSQARALLGPVFYYYLTRDPQVLEAIRGLRETIAKNYRLPDGGYSVRRQDAENYQGNPGRLDAYLELVADLYLMMVPLLPEEEAREWREELKSLTAQIIDRFYAGRHNVFIVDASRQTRASLTLPSVDFGRSARSFRLLLAASALTDDPDLAGFAKTKGRKLLGSSIQMRDGAWSEITTLKGKGGKRRSARVFAEQNQLTAMLALEDPNLANVLQRTYAFWLDRFVDPGNGGVHPVVFGKRRKIRTAQPKHAAGKTGVAEFEHALVAYIASAQLNGAPAVLYFAGETGPDAAVRPYFFDGDVEGIEPLGNTGIRRVSFTNIRVR